MKQTLIPLATMMLLPAFAAAQGTVADYRRAMELRARALPTAQDPMFGSSTNEASVKTSFAVICAWAGEPDLALAQLAVVTKIPGGPSYGGLRLDPMWDPLRGDSRFAGCLARMGLTICDRDRREQGQTSYRA